MTNHIYSQRKYYHTILFLCFLVPVNIASGATSENMEPLLGAGTGLVSTSGARALEAGPIIQAAIAERLIEDGRADVNHLYHQARMYEEGQEGVLQNKRRAHALYEQAAERGHAESMYRLGVMHDDDWDFDFWPSTRWKWYQRAAEAGHPEAQYMMGSKHLYLPSTSDAEQDKKEAKRWLEMAAQQGNVAAQAIIGSVLPIEEGFTWALRAAEAGNTNSQYIVGCLYAAGDGVERNISEAIRWLDSAAEIGHSKARLKLAALAEESIGGLTIEKAISLYKASKDDDSRALKRLGILYEEGEKVAQNYVEAARCYRSFVEEFKSVDKDMDIYYRYARILEEGKIEGQNNQEEAFNLYQQIPDYQDVNYRLGKMFEEGRGTRQDDYQAVAHYQAAATAGHTEAQANLERLKAAGRGLTIGEQITTSCNIM